MIENAGFVTEPWQVRATGLDLEVLAQTESVFALSNGNIGWRANLDEGEPHGLPGSYLNGVFETRPLPFAEAGYGYPESGQTVINVTNGKVIRLLVNDEPFDVRYGHLLSHERVLDLRAGVLRREAEWSSPAGCAVRVTSTRLVSMVQRSIAGICYEVEALTHPVRIVLQSELIANERLPAPADDPRVAAVMNEPLVPEADAAHGPRAGLVHSTAGSGLIVAAVMDHEVDCPVEAQIASETFPHLGRTTVSTTLEPGQRLRLIKYVAYGWSGTRSLPAVRDQADAALAGAVQTGWAGLLDEQRSYLDAFWARSDVEVDGDTRLQQAVRYGLFQVLQAGARAEGRAIPAKGLTGPGYDGHAFWDAETFVLPVLTYTVPSAAADALRWRHTTLDLAAERATQLGLDGAAFPWRTIRGEECSAYWPAGTAAFHINADIAAAVVRYIRATDDVEFERSIGLDLLVGTARLWRSLGHHGAEGGFRIDGVTGPDEYSSVADNNVYTNLMARQNLDAAADIASRHPDGAQRLDVDSEEIASWRDAAAAMFIPYDNELGVHPQSEGFTGHQRWDFDATAPEQYPLMLHFPYFDLYRKQVVKQADLVLAMYLSPEDFTDEQKSRNFAYYEQMTVRDSSLSACIQAIIAAEVGHLELAEDYLAEASLIDLEDLEHNTKDGLHVASLAGVWTAIVAGYGGMRHTQAGLSFAPRLPSSLTGLAFGLILQGRTLRVQLTPTTATYVLLEGEPLEILHYRKAVSVTSREPVNCPIPTARPTGPAPTQPRGRAPVPYRHDGYQQSNLR